MKFIFRLIAPAACLMLVSSCSDDPVSPGGGSYTQTDYHATLLSMDGTFTSVCGTGSNDLYAAGPVILHYDGSRWSPITPPGRNDGRYFDIRYSLGFPNGQLVVSNGRDVFLRKDGAWTNITDDDGDYTNGMWGSAPNDLYMLGLEGVRHFDGTSWSTVALPGVTEAFYAISGSSANDVVIAGRNGRLLHYDGTQWTSQVIDTLVTYQELAVTPSGRVFGSNYDNVYEVKDSKNELVLHDIIVGPMLAADHEVLYVAGTLTYEYSYFVIARYENDNWHNVTLEQGDLYNMWAGDGTVVAGGRDNFIWRGTAAGGGRENTYPQLGRLACATEIDGAIFAAGDGAYRYEDGTWTDLNKEYITHRPVWDIAGRNRYDVYAVGDDMILHYDGQRWSYVNSGPASRTGPVWVDGTGDVWVAGTTQDMYRLQGNTWSSVEISGEPHYIYDMWGTGNTIFAVGSGGFAGIRKDGVWRQVPSTTYTPLTAVWGFDENHVYAVGDTPNLIRFYDGRAWHPVPIDNPDANWNRTIWGTTPANLFVLNNAGTVLHYDGHTWQPLERVFPSGTLSALSGSGRELIAVGLEGVVSYRR